MRQDSTHLPSQCHEASISSSLLYEGRHVLPIKSQLLHWIQPLSPQEGLQVSTPQYHQHTRFIPINKQLCSCICHKKKVFDFIPHHPQVIIPVPYRVVYTLCCICVLTSFIAQPTTMWAFLCHHTTGRVLIKVTNHLYEHFSHFTGPRGRQNNAHSPKMSMP